MKKEKIKLNTIVLILMIFTIFGLSLGSFIYSLNTSFPEIKNLIKPLEGAKAQIASLYFTNIHFTSVTSTSTTIVWETNLLSNSQVNIGTSTDYELTASCASCSSPDELVKTHRISIFGLQPSTTYHYQVVSKTASGEIKTSVDRLLTTPSTSDDDASPYVTYIRVDSTNTEAEFTINTSEDAHVTINYYNPAAAEPITYYSVAEAASDPYTSTHILILTDGIEASTLYNYRIQAEDISGNVSLTGEFDFTSSSDTDHVFSTGQCEGGVPLGSCSGEYYCDVGTATLIRSCGRCGYNCPFGQTCQDDGVCTNDPILTGDPYQCNPDSCYTDGIFNAPAGAGCYFSYPRCDANIILKVRKDRECAKWLTCGTGIEQTDQTTGQKEELCMDLAVCTSLGENGQCNSYVDLPKEEQTFRTPDEIDQIKWLTGSINAGLDWQYEAGSPIIRGYYPWSVMEEVGQKLKILNYNFEEITSESEKAIHLDEDDTSSIYSTKPSYDIGLWTNWSKFPDLETNHIVISTTWKTASQKDTRVLKVQGMEELYQGVSVHVDGSTNTASDYVLSLKVKSDYTDEQKLIFALNNSDTLEGAVSFGEYTLNSGWQEITTNPIKGPGGADTYLIIYLSGGGTQSFYLDDIKLQPVLGIQNDVYLERSCRLYPKDNSMTCEYYDDNGIYNKGWYGYCLQRDPQNELKCISWWPVDILYGESDIFGIGEAVGYTTRTPLYYCLESASTLGLDPEVTCPDESICRPISVTNRGTCDLTRRSNTCFCGASDDHIYYNIGWTHLSVPAEERYLVNKDMVTYATVSITFDDLDIGAHPHNGVKLDESNNWSVWFGAAAPGANWNCDTDLVRSQDWSQSDSIARQCFTSYTQYGCCPDGWATGIQLKFDDNNNLTGYITGVSHHSDGGAGDGLVKIDNLIFYPKEFCSKVVEVVKSGGTDSAWAENINSLAYIVDSDNLNYSINTDYSPFGGSVTPSSQPHDWPSPLFAEDPDKLNYNMPFQLRSGSPYACYGDCSQKICWGGGNREGQDCTTQNCVDTVDPTIIGVCIGVGNSMASDKGEQHVYSDIDDVFTNADNLTFAQARLMGLFAQSYGLWEWTPSVGYESLGYSWMPPTQRCTSEARLSYDITDIDTYCGYAPKITNLKLGDGISNEVKLGSDGGKVKLSFNSIVDRQQQPLTTLYIDWGDGQRDQINYGYKSKDDPSSPHIYTHAYGSCFSGDCRYEIKILAEDNWGWVSSSPNNSEQYYGFGTCIGGLSDSDPCTTDIYCPFGSCIIPCWFNGGICDMDEPYNYLININISEWDPVDSCRGGTCLNGICLDGEDAGRSCNSLIVDLND